jgi:CRISPR/Cas system-associated endonuclease Cas1
LIEKIQNQESNWKNKRVNVRVEIDQIKSQIEEIKNLLVN